MERRAVVPFEDDNTEILGVVVDLGEDVPSDWRFWALLAAVPQLAVWTAVVIGNLLIW